MYLSQYAGCVVVRGSVISAISLRQWKHFLFEGHPTPLNSCVVRVFQCFVNGGAWGALCFKRKRWNAVLHIWSCSLFNKILLSWQLWVFIRISIICVGRPCLYKIFGSVGCLSSDCTWWFLAMPVNFAAGNCPGNVHVGLWAGHPGVECCVPKCPKHCAPDQSTPSAGLPNGHNHARIHQNSTHAVRLSILSVYRESMRIQGSWRVLQPPLTLRKFCWLGLWAYWGWQLKDTNAVGSNQGTTR